MHTHIPRDPEARLQQLTRAGPLALVLLTLTNTLNHLDRHIVSILAEPIKQEFDLDDWQIGVLTGVSFAVFYGLSSLAIGYLADRTNRVRIVAICLAAWSAFTALSSLVQNYVQLVILRILVGFAEGGGSAPSQSLITDLTPRRRRAQALAIFTIGIPLGSFLGMLLGGVLLDMHGWRLGFLVAGIPGLALAVCLLLFLRDPRHELGGAEERTEPQGNLSKSILATVREIWSNEAFLFITLGGVCISFVNYGQSAFLASHFFRTFGAELHQMGAQLFSALGIAFGAGVALGGALGLAKGLPGVIGTLFGGWVADALWARTPAWLGYLPAIAAWSRVPVLVLILFSSSLEIALLLVVLQAFIMGLAAPAGYATIQALARSSTRSFAAASYMFALNIVGLGLGPLAIGLTSDAIQQTGVSPADGLRDALLLIGVIGLLLGGALKWLAHKDLTRRLSSSAA